MILSMTGFGRGMSKDKKRSYSVEIKSVNHRFLEIRIRLPREIQHFEPEIRKEISKVVLRGSVDVVVNREHRPDKEDLKLNLNLPLAKGYYIALEKISRALKLKSSITAETVAKFPEVLQVYFSPVDDRKEFSVLNRALKAAVAMMLKMKGDEGRNLSVGMRRELGIIGNSVQGLIPLREKVVTQYRDKLNDRIKKLDLGRELDESRILQEVALYADRSDISEELSRLVSHISQFREALLGRGLVGRKLDFLVQEFLREANTVGSKFPDATLDRLIEMKSSIEKLREQVQNIE